MESYSPLRSFANTIAALFSGRMHFPRDQVGKALVLDDGQEWVIFRQAVLDSPIESVQSAGAVFRPRFHVAKMPVRVNIWFSLLPIPFFVGLPGFRSKLWLYHPSSGDFQGIYEWNTVEDAERYAASFAMRFMVRRSVPGSVSYKIIPTSLS